MAEFSAFQGVSRPWRRALLIGGGIALLMLITRGEDLTGGVIHQYPGPGMNLWRLR